MRNLTGCLLRWRLLRCLCLLLVFSTSLLNISIESRAEEFQILSGSASGEAELLSSEDLEEMGAVFPPASARVYYYKAGTLDLGSYDLADKFTLSDEQYYSVDLELSGEIVIADDVISFPCNFVLINNNVRYELFPATYIENGKTNVSYPNTLQNSISLIFKGSDSVMNFEHVYNIYSNTVSVLGLECSLKFNFSNLTPLASSDSSDYQDGYNAGYAEGETDGYSNGYSQGYLEGEENGFQAGQDSVDTDKYYDAGYNVGYSSGYATGYDEGYSSALKSVQASDGAWGQYKFLGTMQKVKRAGVPFYVSSNGLIDMEEYQSGANGYFYNTQPGTHDGYSTISYHIPFYDFSNGYTKIDSNKFNVKFEVLGINPYLTSDLGGGDSVANIMRSRVEEVYVVYNGKKYYGNYDIGTSYVQFDFFVENVAKPTLLGDASMTLYFVLHNTVTLVTDSHESIYISGQYLPNLEFELGRDTAGYAVAIRPYISNDRVSANIKDQTEQITGSLEEQKEIQQGQLEEQKEQTETQKGIAASIKDFFGSFFDNLINSIIHVIVPTKEEMGELFNRLNDFFAETFGFLYYPFEFIINAFNIFLVADSGTGLTLPAFSIMGYEVWGNQTYDIASEPIVGEIFGFVRMGTGAMLVMWFVNFLKDFFDKRFGGGGS